LKINFGYRIISFHAVTYLIGNRLHAKIVTGALFQPPKAHEEI